MNLRLSPGTSKHINDAPVAGRMNTPLEMNMNAKQRYSARRAAEHREKKQYAGKINRAFARLSGEGSERVVQALRAPNWRQPKEETGSACLPQVALYSAGHRKSENVTAR